MDPNDPQPENGIPLAIVRVDETVGSIDEVNHCVVLHKPGDTTITGTMYKDTSASFELHVIGPPMKLKSRKAKASYKKLKKKNQTINLKAGYRLVFDSK